MQANDDIFVYTGARGEQVPENITRVRVDKSVKIIPDRAFSGREDLEEVHLHEGIKEIRYGAFYGCKRLRRINFPANLSVIGWLAFAFCHDLADLEFPERLQMIGEEAFRACNSLTIVKLPENLDVLGKQAFLGCICLKEVEIPSGRKRIGIGYGAFGSCTNLKRIATPLNVQLLSTNHQIFDGCVLLNSINITGGVHEVISALALEKWRNEINAEIRRINSILPNIIRGPKTMRMHEWMESVHFKIERYKLEHNKLMKEATSLLELALWKAKLEEDGFATKKRKRRALSRVNCGAAVVIENVCSYLRIFN
jgi:hypothetical protein